MLIMLIIYIHAYLYIYISWQYIVYNIILDINILYINVYRAVRYTFLIYRYDVS